MSNKIIPYLQAIKVISHFKAIKIIPISQIEVSHI